MRIILPITLLFCLLYFPTSAQNWEAFNSGKTYHYKSDTASLPDQSVHFDSIVTVGADSTFNTARRFRAGVDTSLRNLAMFCGREITFFADGSFNFRNPINVFLPTQAGLGSAFILDSISGLTATVSRVYQGTILGSTLDSIKVFTTANLDSLVISKAHGLLEWPASIGSGHFTLVGIQEDGLGDTLPGFDGFYKYKAGDVYYYQSALATGDLILQEDEYKVKMAIDSALRGPTGLHVYWSGIVNHTMSLGGNVVNTTGTVTSGDFMVLDPGNALVDKSHEEQIRVPNSLSEIALPLPWATYRRNPSADPNNNAWDGLWTTMSYKTVSAATELHYGRDFGAVGWMYYGIGGDTCLPSTLDHQRAVIRAGKGLTHVDWAGFDQFGSFDLVGTIIDGDTNGTIFPDAVLLSSATPVALEGLLEVFPNPNNGAFTVRMGNAGDAELELIDAQGKVCYHGRTTGIETKLDFSGFPSGVYLIRFTQGTKHGMQRVLLTR